MGETTKAQPHGIDAEPLDVGQVRADAMMSPIPSPLPSVKLRG
jgi:hypothetical protein